MSTRCSFFLFILLAFLWSNVSAQVYTGCDPQLLQCDNCSTSAQWSTHAISNSPALPYGYDHMECTVHTMNLSSYQVKRFRVVKIEEPGLYQEFAAEESLLASDQQAFDDLFAAIQSYESTPQSIVLPPQAPVDSAYQITYNSQAYNDLLGYIADNHGAYITMLEGLGAVELGLSILGADIDNTVTIRVVFPDGSEGVLALDHIGLTRNGWVPLEATFIDSDGNRIRFDAGNYDGQQGVISSSSATYLVNRLSAGGWNVSQSGSGGSCSWSCSGSVCNLSCETE